MATAPRKNGFTLIELLIAMVLVAILATIGVNRFWSVKDRGLETSVKSDLREFASQQEDYFQFNYNYAADPASIPDYVNSPGVSVTVTYSGIDGWAATAAHSSLTGKNCGILIGNAPAASAPPATSPGLIECN
jgi:prepilin-type N-terminal cleavage/methylation domain-containing protein